MSPIKTLTVCGALAAAGCASIPLPADKLETYEATVRSAQELGGNEVPAARLHIKLAQDDSVAAKQLAERRDERAPLVLARAEAEADLALVLAREAATHREANRASEELKTLQSQPAP